MCNVLKSTRCTSKKCTLIGSVNSPLNVLGDQSRFLTRISAFLHLYRLVEILEGCGQNLVCLGWTEDLLTHASVELINKLDIGKFKLFEPLVTL